MQDLNDIVGAEFVRLLSKGELDAISRAFDSFSHKVIDFIHKPFNWAEKHICLVRLNAIFKVIKANGTECTETLTYLELAISLVTSMKALLLQAQGLNPDSLTSTPNPCICANGQPLAWTDGENGLYELINCLHAKGAFNNGEANIADITLAFSAMLNMNINAESCYENGRRMRMRKGKSDAPLFDLKKRIPGRDYYIWELHACINNKLIQQDNAGDGRCARKG